MRQSTTMEKIQRQYAGKKSIEKTCIIICNKHHIIDTKNVLTTVLLRLCRFVCIAYANWKLHSWMCLWTEDEDRL